jgi:Cyclic nucleotide-binding domain
MTSGVVASDDPLAHQAYLGENQLQILREYGTEQAVGDGDVLFVDGDHTYDLIVVLEGFVKVVEGYGKPDSDAIVTYGPNEFVGEMGLLTGQRVFLTGVASGSGRILRIPVPVKKSIRPAVTEFERRGMLAARVGPEPSSLTTRSCDDPRPRCLGLRPRPPSATQPPSRWRMSPSGINWRCCSDQSVDPGSAAGTGSCG